MILLIQYDAKFDHVDKGLIRRMVAWKLFV